MFFFTTGELIEPLMPIKTNYIKDPFQNIKMKIIVANINGRHQMITSIIEIIDLIM